MLGLCYLALRVMRESVGGRGWSTAAGVMFYPLWCILPHF